MDGWHCSNGDHTQPDTCQEQCNDGYITPGEYWEDGDTSSLDGCSSTWQFEPGWTCTNNTALTLTTWVHICGDNYRVSTEACDDGDNSDNEGCLSDCSGEMDGWHCSNGDHTQPDTCQEQCNDGFITPSEYCEDGNTSSLDGCSSTCQFEPGWTCTNNTALTSTSWVNICGDNYRVSTEACDDGDITDSQGCLPDCSGEIDGWHCSNGDHTQPDTCHEQCHDGFITINEEWEDGNADPTDGCDDWVIQVGWTCTDNTAMTYSTWVPICGDGLQLGNEVCDDGNDTDGKGCLADCSGVMPGWYCSPGVVNAHDWITKLRDGIHISPEEGCDDGNSVDWDDGCTNQGKVEAKWDWVDDLLKRSVWVPMWSNAKVETSYEEECDDTNRDDDDGCSRTWLIEEGWQCFNGSITSRSYCYEQPIVSIESVSKTNEIVFDFTQDMSDFDVSETTIAFEYNITGPLTPYIYLVNVTLDSPTKLKFNITFESQQMGDDKEILTIKFNKTEIKSTDGANLYNSELSTPLEKVPILPDVIAAIGTGINNMMSITMIVLISSNILLGQSSELMWGFLNTIQIMFFFPLLMLYYPDNLAQLLTYFSASKMTLPIPPIESLKSNVKESFGLASKLNMPALNQRYESIDYESTSFLLNSDDLLSVIIQGVVICIVVYGIRAWLFTLSSQTLIEEYGLQLQKLEGNTQSPIVSTQPVNETKMRKWFKKKIREMSQEYRFNFFCRMGVELYLEAMILSLLNLRYAQADNFYRFISTIVSGGVLIVLTLFLWWSTYFSCKNFNKFKHKDRVDIPEVEAMFGQYKTTFLPQGMFNTYFMLRRTAYAIIIIFLDRWPVVQAFTFSLWFVPILAYHYVMNPYLKKIENVMMNINETSFIIIGGFFFIFAEKPKDQDTLNIQGIVVITLIIMVILMNIIVLWVLKIRMLYLEFIEWYQAYKEKENKPTLKSIVKKSGLFEEYKISEDMMISKGRPDELEKRYNEFIKSDLSMKTLTPSQFLRENELYKLNHSQLSPTPRLT